MRPRERRETGEQDMFRSRLDQVINMDHAPAKLAGQEHGRTTPLPDMELTTNSIAR
jgi:hypothetical protein